jgi:FAD binding domain
LQLTFIPKSVVGVQNIVKFAKSVDKKVRVAGYRHSFEAIFGSDKEILLSLLPLDVAIDIPSFDGAFAPGAGLLQLIEPGMESADKLICKVGAATTTDDLRQWCVANGWAVPWDVVIVETTYGGTISAMCHGAGLATQTLSDLVKEVEFVDPNGQVRTVSDPELLKAASGALGVLGVVTAYTIQLDKMTYAAMRPMQVPIELAVPPPQEYIDAAEKGDPKYKWIKELVSQHSQKTLDDARTEFIRRAEGDYYAEWFWFPLQRNVWVNTWNNDGVEAQSTTIPNNFDAFLQWLEGWIAEIIIDWSVFQALPGELQAKIFSFFTLTQLENVQPGDPTRKIPI